MTVFTVSEGMSNPMPTEPPDGEKIALDVVVVGAGADVAAAGRDDAGRYGATETEGIADSDHPIADAWLVIRKLDEREVAAVNLDEREVGPWIRSDYLGRQDLAVIGHHLYGLGMLDHMVVGYGIAIGGDEEARALPGQVTGRLLGIVRQTKPSQEPVERGALPEWHRIFFAPVKTAYLPGAV
jgi:hypothetical protein